MGLCASEKREQTEHTSMIAWSDRLKLGDHTLKNRVVMAAMTRLRCDPNDGIPNDLLTKYNAQRAGSGLLITESSAWSQRGIAYPGSGDIFAQKQA